MRKKSLYNINHNHIHTLLEIHNAGYLFLSGKDFFQSIHLFLFVDMIIGYAFNLYIRLKRRMEVYSIDSSVAVDKNQKILFMGFGCIIDLN